MFNIFKSLGQNKQIMNIALSQVRGMMERDNIAVIVIRAIPVEEGQDVPGLQVHSFSEQVGILSGHDLGEYVEFRKAVNDAQAVETKKEEDHV